MARSEALEKAFQNQFREQLHRRGHWTEKTHGGLYSSGLPDVLVFLHQKDATVPLIAAVEAKIVDSVYTVAALFDSLRGSVKTPSRQRAVGWELAKRGSPAGILALDRADNKAVFAFFWEAIAYPTQPPCRWSVDSMGAQFLQYVEEKYAHTYAVTRTWRQANAFDDASPLPPGPLD